MAPKEVLRPGRVAVKQRAGDDEDSAQSGSQTSGEDKVVKMAEAMKRRVCYSQYGSLLVPNYG